MRNYSLHISAYASLLALDGHGDAALAEVRSLYGVAHKLESNSRTLVRAMIAVTIQRTAIETAVFVLDHATVSPAAQAEFSTTLAAMNAPAGARRLLLIEHVGFTPLLVSLGSGLADTSYFGGKTTVWHYPLLAVNRLVVNPRATQNLIGERFYELAALAGPRDLVRFMLRTHEIERDFAGVHQPKNLGGRLLANLRNVRFDKIVTSYWETEDARLALLARLKPYTAVASH
ncbi:MAG: hypothetical protein EXS39_05100 [Opitutaceae bacterium]|nr:hypothetical protein [Opitutaceae bacterium]